MKSEWLWFTISGTVVSLLVWIGQRRLWRLWVLGVAGAVLLALFLFIGYLSLGPATLGRELPWYSASPGREILLFVVMILGMAARYFSKAIEVRRQRIADLRAKGGPYAPPKLEFDAWEFAYPLFGSVITFGVLLSQTEDAVLNAPTLALSFQTGFFWQTLLTSKETGLAGGSRRE